MTTEAEVKKALKPEDVERWAQALADYTSRGAMSSDARAHADECIAALCAAALEGAQVAALLEDHAPLRDAIGALLQCPSRTSGGAKAPVQARAKLALSLPGPGAELLTEKQRQVAAFQEQLGAARDSEHAARVRAMEHATKADALQARVTKLDVANAALQAQVADLTQRRAALVDRREGLRAERDASRLEVETFKAALRRLDALLCFRTRWRVGDGGVTDTSGIDEVFATFRRLLGWEGVEVVDPEPLPPSQEVSALQTKVAELMRAKDEAKNEYEAARDERDEAQQQRAALQAQMERFRISVESVRQMLSNGQHRTAETHMTLALASLSASPSAQRCPTHPDDGVCEPVLNKPGRCVYGEHAMPTPPAEAPRPKRKRSTHDDRTCGACEGPLETSRDAVCESCTPEADAHAIALSMAPATPTEAMTAGRCATGNTCVCGECPADDE